MSKVFKNRWVRAAALAWLLAGGIHHAAAADAAGGAQACDASSAREERCLMRGIWRLTSFYRITSEGKRVEWCHGVHGYLDYTSAGMLFASINCDEIMSPDDPAAKYGYMIHYAASYVYDPATRAIRHSVLNSSKLDMIGTTVVRYLGSVDDRVLSLTVPSDHDSITHLEWERQE